MKHTPSYKPYAKLSDLDRAELCAGCDFLSILTNDGAEPKPCGSGMFRCQIRAERSPSCMVYMPGIGKYGDKGWTWNDYGNGQSGDALAYLIEVREYSFAQAVQFLIKDSRFIPEGFSTDDHIQSAPRRFIPSYTPIVIDWKRQREAVNGFIAALDSIDRQSESKAKAYLAQRGIVHIDGAALVRSITDKDMAYQVAKILFFENAQLYKEAGILKDKDYPALQWFKKAALLFSVDRDGVNGLYCNARLFDGNCKYINQSNRGGARKLVFGLPMLREAAEEKKELFIVEGAIDSLAARQLGLCALATLTRPCASSFEGIEQAVIEDLRACAQISILPDQDDCPKKMEAGRKHALALADWLNDRGCNARVVSMSEMGFSNYKDLAEVTKAQK